MPALKAVSQHLEAAEAEAEAKLQQVNHLLNKLLLGSQMSNSLHNKHATRSQKSQALLARSK